MIPFNSRLSLYGEEAIETSKHVLLCCHFYANACHELLILHFVKYPGHSVRFWLNLLFSDSKKSISLSVAKFCHVIYNK